MRKQRGRGPCRTRWLTRPGPGLILGKQQEESVGSLKSACEISCIRGSGDVAMSTISLGDDLSLGGAEVEGVMKKERMGDGLSMTFSRQAGSAFTLSLIHI